MNSDTRCQLFKEVTDLKSGQIKQLVSRIHEYDESDELSYEIIGKLGVGVSLSTIMDELAQEKFGWESSTFAESRKKRDFQDSLLARPPEVREGEIECPKCHHKKTLVVEMQTRSADEGYTYYIHCFNPTCKAITK